MVTLLQLLSLLVLCSRFTVALSFNETFEQPLFPQSKPREDCESNKVKCHNDTDCYHRLFYVHSTCILGGACKPQCKTAILRLYESEYGRKLLHSDLNCVSAVKSELFDCDLSPEAETVHCTLARQICHADVECHESLEIYESQCESKLLNTHKCPKLCVNYLASVYKTAEGRKVSSCQCWPDEDALCQHRKSHALDPCNELALQSVNERLGSGESKEQLDQIVLNIIEREENLSPVADKTPKTSQEFIVQISNKCSTVMTNMATLLTLIIVMIHIVVEFYINDVAQ